MYEDAAVADALIEKSACEWVIVRPMSFTNGVKTGDVSVVTDPSLAVRLRLRITRADVAAFLVEQVVEDDTLGKCPSSTRDNADSAAGIRESGRDRCNVRARGVEALLSRPHDPYRVLQEPGKTRRSEDDQLL